MGQRADSRGLEKIKEEKEGTTVTGFNGNIDEYGGGSW